MKDTWRVVPDIRPGHFIGPNKMRKQQTRDILQIKKYITIQIELVFRVLII